MNRHYKINFKKIGEDDIGYITSLESNKNVPFDIKRVYYIYNVPTYVNRGFHAHKDLEQILICVSGALKVKCFDGKFEKIYEMNIKNEGLYIGRDIWHEMFDYKEETVLMVLASDYYNESDYIRDYGEFLKIVNIE